jgi:hypothetical protein
LEEKHTESVMEKFQFTHPACLMSSLFFWKSIGIASFSSPGDRRPRSA